MHRLCLFVLCVFLCDAVSAADTVSFPGLGEASETATLVQALANRVGWNNG